MEKRWADYLWFAAWALASSAWCLTAAARLGPTFDEPLYVQRGLDGWRTFSHQGLLKLGTMPLPIDVQTLPLYLWERWQGTSFDLATDADRMLPWPLNGKLGCASSRRSNWLMPALPRYTIWTSSSVGRRFPGEASWKCRLTRAEK